MTCQLASRLMSFTYIHRTHTHTTCMFVYYIMCTLRVYVCVYTYTHVHRCMCIVIHYVNPSPFNIMVNWQPVCIAMLWMTGAMQNGCSLSAPACVWMCSFDIDNRQRPWNLVSSKQPSLTMFQSMWSYLNIDQRLIFLAICLTIYLIILSVRIASKFLSEFYSPLSHGQSIFKNEKIISKYLRRAFKNRTSSCCKKASLANSQRIVAVYLVSLKRFLLNVTNFSTCVQWVHERAREAV